ncbi:MAG: gamma-glutamyltransferase [Hyphomicrobiaceae bacterium]|nr:gamma-glutamyltransferase [Hyphomicrobiaceae bacterium]
MIVLRCYLFALSLLFAPCCLAQGVSLAPEAESGRSEKGLVIAHKDMVVAAHPLAAEAGREMLRKGGSAVDAAIAVQMVLGLVEPQSSGLGGGAFIVHWDRASKAVTTFDGRETAPASAKPDRFLDASGNTIAFDTAVRSGLSVGVPGVVRALEMAHRKFGKLPWATLFEPARKLAREGFPVGERLNALLTIEGPDRFPETARHYFFDEAGAPRAVGSLLRNPEYEATLARIAKEGAGVFYEGDIAQDIVDAVAQAPFASGGMTVADVNGYQSKEREATCFAYRMRKICGMPPPSSGTLTVAQTLKLIEPLGGVEGKNARMAPQAVHLIAEAEKLAFADRNRYIADPDFVTVPRGFLDAGYVAERRNLIGRATTMEKPQAGLPPGVSKRTFGIDGTHEQHGTSHISIVDADGNALSMTTTIESAFGSHLMTHGFLLNNELTDFSFRPAGDDGVPAANRVEGNKRPRSSMAPLIVFAPDGQLYAVTGSPGGSRIILFMVKTLVALIDWDMNASEAAALENFGSEGGPVQLEEGVSDFWLTLVLKSYGQEVVHMPMTSGIHTIVRRDGRLEGGADPRREGIALGD